MGMKNSYPIKGVGIIRPQREQPCDVILSLFFNSLTAFENGGTPCTEETLNYSVIPSLIIF